MSRFRQTAADPNKYSHLQTRDCSLFAPNVSSRSIVPHAWAWPAWLASPQADSPRSGVYLNRNCTTVCMPNHVAEMRKRIYVNSYKKPRKTTSFLYEINLVAPNCSMDKRNNFRLHSCQPNSLQRNWFPMKTFKSHQISGKGEYT